MAIGDQPANVVLQNGQWVQSNTGSNTSDSNPQQTVTELPKQTTVKISDRPDRPTETVRPAQQLEQAPAQQPRQPAPLENSTVRQEDDMVIQDAGEDFAIISYKSNMSWENTADLFNMDDLPEEDQAKVRKWVREHPKNTGSMPGAWSGDMQRANEAWLQGGMKGPAPHYAPESAYFEKGFDTAKAGEIVQDPFTGKYEKGVVYHGIYSQYEGKYVSQSMSDYLDNQLRSSLDQQASARINQTKGTIDYINYEGLHQGETPIIKAYIGAGAGNYAFDDVAIYGPDTIIYPGSYAKMPAPGDYYTAGNQPGDYSGTGMLAYTTGRVQKENVYYDPQAGKFINRFLETPTPASKLGFTESDFKISDPAVYKELVAWRQKHPENAVQAPEGTMAVTSGDKMVFVQAPPSPKTGVSAEEWLRSKNEKGIPHSIESLPREYVQLPQKQTYGEKLQASGEYLTTSINDYVSGQLNSPKGKAASIALSMALKNTYGPFFSTPENAGATIEGITQFGSLSAGGSIWAAGLMVGGAQSLSQNPKGHAMGYVTTAEKIPVVLPAIPGALYTSFREKPIQTSIVVGGNVLLLAGSAKAVLGGLRVSRGAPKGLLSSELSARLNTIGMDADTRAVYMDAFRLERMNRGIAPAKNTGINLENIKQIGPERAVAVNEVLQSETHSIYGGATMDSQFKYMTPRGTNDLDVLVANPKESAIKIAEKIGPGVEASIESEGLVKNIGGGHVVDIHSPQPGYPGFDNIGIKAGINYNEKVIGRGSKLLGEPIQAAVPKASQVNDLSGLRYERLDFGATRKGNAVLTDIMGREITGKGNVGHRLEKDLFDDLWINQELMNAQGSRLSSMGPLTRSIAEYKLARAQGLMQDMMGRKLTYHTGKGGSWQTKTVSDIYSGMRAQIQEPHLSAPAGSAAIRITAPPRYYPGAASRLPKIGRGAPALLINPGTTRAAENPFEVSSRPSGFARRSSGSSLMGRSSPSAMPASQSPYIKASTSMSISPSPFSKSSPSPWPSPPPSRVTPPSPWRQPPPSRHVTPPSSRYVPPPSYRSIPPPYRHVPPPSFISVPPLPPSPSPRPKSSGGNNLKSFRFDLDTPALIQKPSKRGNNGVNLWTNPSIFSGPATPTIRLRPRKRKKGELI